MRYPDKTICTGGGTEVLSERARGRNWYQWVHWGLIHYWGNQAYRDRLDRFTADLKLAMEQLEGTNAVYIPIVGLGWGHKDHPAQYPEMMVQQINAARQLDGHRNVKLGGIALFASRNLTLQHAQALREGPFKHKAILPWHAAPDRTQGRD